MGQFYAVKKGRAQGVFSTWDECKKQVDGFSGAQFKKFSSKKEALAYLEDEVIIDSVDGLIAYVDGSFNEKTEEYGYACVFIDQMKVIEEISGKGDQKDYAMMRNVAGEIISSMTAVHYAIEHGYSSLHIYYDYYGIEYWVTGEWDARTIKTKEYQIFMKEYQKSINIYFHKVPAHSHIIYNERADTLAKKAVGIL